MNLAILIENDSTLLKWQFESLKLAVERGHSISRVIIAMSRKKKRKYQYSKFLYYFFVYIFRQGLNANKRMSLLPLLSAKTEIKYFDPIQEGIWERIPESAATFIESADVLIKFGMGLLRDPQNLPCKYGVISYHHGDPSSYRGQPAGFWEMRHEQSLMGVIIQQINNKLDAGRILNISYSRVCNYSYRKTLNSAYLTSIPMLVKALSALDLNQFIDLSKSKEIFSIPKPKDISIFFFQTVRNKLKRIFYGLLFEKRWKVGNFSTNTDPVGDLRIRSQNLNVLPIPEGFTFVADPCGFSRGKLYAEVMNAKSGKGVLGIWNEDSWEIIDMKIEGHLSYPQIVNWEGDTYVFPEISKSSAPCLFKVDLAGVPTGERFFLRGLDDKRLLDGTLFNFENYWYLFASMDPDSHQNTKLFYSGNLNLPFTEHPESPIILDPRASRMAGPIHQSGKVLFRFGQNCIDKYGDGISVSIIEVLSPTHYKELRVGTIQVEGARGPHTLLFTENKVWIDFYEEKFVFTAGLRRIKAKYF